MNRSRPMFPLPLLLMALLLAGCTLLPAGRSSRMAANEPEPTPIPTPIVPIKPTYAVQRGEIVHELTFSGRVSPVVEQELFFRTGGRVRHIYAKRNERVTAGQVIAELEIDDLVRELRSAQLDLERAQARLAAAQQSLEFDQRVAKINLEIAQLRLVELQTQAAPDSYAVAIQQKQVELAGISLSRLQAGVDPLLVNDVARNELNLLKLESAVSDATITASFDGLLLSVSLTAGRAVEAFHPVVVIADVSELEVSADLVSSQMQNMAEGMEVTVAAASRPGLALQGEVRRLPYPYGSGGSGSSVDEPDKSTRVALNAAATEAGLSLGDLVRVNVVLERKADVLWLPPQAIRTFDGRRFAVVQDEEAQRRVDVKVGIQTPDRVEITEGLAEGQVAVGQ